MSLRQLFLDRRLDLRLSSYDNIPDCLFNSSSVGGAGKSMQRTTIVLAKPSNGVANVETTDLLKWWAQDRPNLFSKMEFAASTDYCSSESFPRLGNTNLLPFWSRLRRLPLPLSQFSEDITSESRRPEANSFYLTIPRAVNYFISATPGSMPRNKVLSMTFKTKEDMDLGRVLLNSNIFFWYWRACGDGFLLGVDVLGDFPVPEAYDKNYIALAKKLDCVLQECTTFKLYRGEKIPSYNFNKRMDILLDIDDWIVKHIAPDLNLPRGIFAQYKSNSFLRPLDLSAITGAAAEVEDEE